MTIQSRLLLDTIGLVASELRRIRYANVDQFDDLTDIELEQATRGLERLAVDCRASADQLRRALAARAHQP